MSHEFKQQIGDNMDGILSSLPTVTKHHDDGHYISHEFAVDSTPTTTNKNINTMMMKFNRDDDDDDDDDSNSDACSDVLEDIDDRKKENEVMNNMKDTDEYRISCEANKVTFWVTIILVVSSLLSSLVIGIVLPNKELDSIGNEFDNAVDKLFNHISEYGVRNIQGMASLSSSLTSYSILANEFSSSLTGEEQGQLGSWPYVTDPQYVTNSMYTRITLNATHVVSTPIIKSEDSFMWSLYTQSMNNKIQSLTTNNNIEIAPNVWKVDPNTGEAIQDNSKVSYPVWQVSPLMNTVGDMNFNLGSISSIGKTLNHTTLTPGGIGSMSPFLPDTKEELKILQNISFLVDDVELSATEGPFSLLSIPVYDSFVPIHQNKTSSEEVTARNVVAALSTPFLWKSYFENVYSNHIQGVMVILISSCNSPDNNNNNYTYRINGETVMYEGVGDLHHHFFSKYKKSANINQLIKDYALIQGIQTVDQISLSHTYCPFTIDVYPTAEFQNQLLTKNPALFTGTILCIWSFVLLLFVMYGGYMIENVQALIEKASHNRSIVNKLFPQEVQERMRQLSQETDAKNMKTDDPLLNIKSVLKEEANEIDETPPIADLFASATVMFADIAGFTKWSSERNPVEVFTLLETMYASFDSIARRRRVFKVETIGDCYMCVTGLPEARPDHALAMAVFCHECLKKLPKVLMNLAPKVGADVLDLNLRFGMHSGPVTAGVLRGEKSRFQLFGDTVNFASRMESTGLKGKIQLSDFTARELIAAGKEHWLELREGGVEAKGKGTLQTYWLKTSAIKSVGTLSTQSSHSAESDDVEGDD